MQETASLAVDPLLRGAAEEGERRVGRLLRGAGRLQVLRPGLVPCCVHRGGTAPER